MCLTNYVQSTTELVYKTSTSPLLRNHSERTSNWLVVKRKSQIEYRASLELTTFETFCLNLRLTLKYIPPKIVWWFGRQHTVILWHIKRWEQVKTVNIASIGDIKVTFFFISGRESEKPTSPVGKCVFSLRIEKNDFKRTINRWTF